MSKTPLHAKMLAMKAALTANASAQTNAVVLASTRQERLACRVLASLRTMGYKDNSILAALTGATEDELANMPEITDADLAQAGGAEDEFTPEEVMSATIKAIKGMAEEGELPTGAGNAEEVTAEVSDEDAEEVAEILQMTASGVMRASTRKRLMVSLVATMNTLMLSEARGK